MSASAYSFLLLYLTLAQLYLGTLAILCFRVMVKPRWLEPLVPAVERAQRLGWALALGFPLLAWLAPHLYPWGLEPVHGNAFRCLYLSPAGFAARGVGYWALWLTLSRAARRRQAWSGGPGLVLLVLSGTFASVDWELSLSRHFGSTIFGMVFLLSCFLLAFAYAVFFGSERSAPEARRDQGSVHLSILCVWTYVSFMQLLVVWSGNLPEEAEWYRLREQGGWAAIPAVVGPFQFFVPFFLLLQSPVKNRRARAGH